MPDAERELLEYMRQLRVALHDERPVARVLALGLGDPHAGRNPAFAADYDALQSRIRSRLAHRITAL